MSPNSDKAEAHGADQPPRDLSPEARRALAEAVERHRQAANREAPPREIGGRKGPDPVRFGDWEQNGIASDF